MNRLKILCRRYLMRMTIGVCAAILTLSVVRTARGDHDDRHEWRHHHYHHGHHHARVIIQSQPGYYYYPQPEPYYAPPPVVYAPPPPPSGLTLIFPFHVH